MEQCHPVVQKSTSQHVQAPTHGCSQQQTTPVSKLLKHMALPMSKLRDAGSSQCAKRWREPPLSGPTHPLPSKIAQRIPVLTATLSIDTTYRLANTPPPTTWVPSPAGQDTQTQMQTQPCPLHAKVRIPRQRRFAPPNTVHESSRMTATRKIHSTHLSIY